MKYRVPFGVVKGNQTAEHGSIITLANYQIITLTTYILLTTSFLSLLYWRLHQSYSAS